MILVLVHIFPLWLVVSFLNKADVLKTTGSGGSG